MVEIIMSTSKVSTAWFADILAKWPQGCGPKPTHEQLSTVLLLGKRPGVEALHVAMCLRPQGCTVHEYTYAAATGTGKHVGPANNYRRRLQHELGYLNIVETGRPLRFTATLTAKGKQVVAGNEKVLQAGAVKTQATKAPAKAPTAAKGNSKPKAAKAGPKPGKATSKPGMVTVSHGDHKGPPAPVNTGKPAIGDDGGPVQRAASMAPTADKPAPVKAPVTDQHKPQG